MFKKYWRYEYHKTEPSRHNPCIQQKAYKQFRHHPYICMLCYGDKVIIYIKKSFGHAWLLCTPLVIDFVSKSMFSCGIQGARHDYKSIYSIYVYKTFKYEWWIAYTSFLI